VPILFDKIFKPNSFIKVPGYFLLSKGGYRKCKEKKKTVRLEVDKKQKKRVSTKAPPTVRLSYTCRWDRRVSKTTDSRNMKVMGVITKRKP
jgi:hypothetical protein